MRTLLSQKGTSRKLEDGYHINVRQPPTSEAMSEYSPRFSVNMLDLMHIMRQIQLDVFVKISSIQASTLEGSVSSDTSANEGSLCENQTRVEANRAMSLEVLHVDNLGIKLPLGVDPWYAMKDLTHPCDIHFFALSKELIWGMLLAFLSRPCFIALPKLS
eukprot:scaffold23295_cov31-Prasinocladus_malaysianus.AAC.4